MSEMNGVVCFLYPEMSPTPFRGGNRACPAQLYYLLAQRGLESVVAGGAEQAFVEDSVTVASPNISGMPGLSSWNLPLNVLGAMVSGLDRSIKNDQLACPEALPPTINENATRSLVHRKIRAHREVFEPLGLAIPTTLVSSGEDIETFLAKHPAELLMVKPNTGTRSRGIQQVRREELQQLFADNPVFFEEGKEQRIIQPAYDFTMPLPVSLRRLDDASEQDFEYWSKRDEPKELRIYGFHSPTDTTVFPVGRTFRQGNDHWFFVDPDSVPGDLLNNTGKIIARTAEISGAIAVHGTVDWGYDSEGIWRPIELNGKMPYMIEHRKHAGVARQLRELLADQILAVATAQYDRVST